MLPVLIGDPGLANGLCCHAGGHGDSHQAQVAVAIAAAMLNVGPVIATTAGATAATAAITVALQLHCVPSC